jgi:hypothetical protein
MLLSTPPSKPDQAMAMVTSAHSLLEQLDVSARDPFSLSVCSKLTASPSLK